MRPVGGYFELACRDGGTFHDGVLLNSSRNALRYIIRAYGIKAVHVPTYTCPVVCEAITSEGCVIITYDLNKRMLPACDFAESDYIVYNNYFGVLGKNVDEIAARYPNLIVDNAQAFYSKSRGRACFYSPRKFFGLPDGGIAVGANMPRMELPESTSFEVCSHLLKRHDLDASAGYADFQANDDALCEYPVAKMSMLTRAIMGNVDYEGANRKRKENFSYLHAKLQSSFPFALADDDVPMVYPYVTDDMTLRSRLIEQKIYVAKYWPGLSPAANALAERIIPLPIDQRYGPDDMKRIVEVIRG